MIAGDIHASLQRQTTSTDPTHPRKETGRRESTPSLVTPAARCGDPCFTTSGFEEISLRHVLRGRRGWQTPVHRANLQTQGSPGCLPDPRPPGSAQKPRQARPAAGREEPEAEAVSRLKA